MKTGVFWHFFPILTVFRSLCLSGAILAHKISNGMFSGSWRIFWHPWDPWGWIHIDLNKNSVQNDCANNMLNKFTNFIFKNISQTVNFLLKFSCPDMRNFEFLLITTKTKSLVNLLNINEKFLLKFSKNIPAQIQGVSK